MAKRLIVEGAEARAILRWLVRAGRGDLLGAGANAVEMRVVGSRALLTPWNARVEIPGTDPGPNPHLDAPDALSKAAWRRLLRGPSALAPAIVGALTLILFGACAALLGRLAFGVVVGESVG